MISCGRLDGLPGYLDRDHDSLSLEPFRCETVIVVGCGGVGSGAILFCALSLLNNIFGLHERDGAVLAGANGKGQQKIHMDIASKTAHLPGGVILKRGFQFFGWMASFMAVMAVIGLIPTVPIFIVSYMRIEGRESWKIAIAMAAAVTLLIYVVFDQLLAIPWPPTYFGDWFPALKVIPSV